MEIKGKLIHCYGIVECQEPKEEGYKEENGISLDSFRNIFLKDFSLDYILDLAIRYELHFHIVSHSERTSTCQEKADITGLPLERVIKGVYLEDVKTKNVYSLAIPGNKTYNKLKLAEYININQDEAESRIRKSKWLPMHIEFGTVHPFVNCKSFNHPYGNGKLECILFDKDHLEKRRGNGLDDFSFTTHPSTGYDNHRLSIQINYQHAYVILSTRFPEKVKAIELI
ncbi:MAG: hypothetical protein AABX45_00700 [Nanoarchaeota archaeon]